MPKGTGRPDNRDERDARSRDRGAGGRDFSARAGSKRGRDRGQRSDRNAIKRPVVKTPPPSAPKPQTGPASAPGGEPANTTEGLGTQGRRRARTRASTLLTLGLADTAKKTLLGL